jgi:hypothetical protein
MSETRVISGWTAADGFGFTQNHPSTEAADRVKSAIEDYRDKYDRGEPLETVASDFLADLFLWLASEGEDPEQIVTSAELHFHAENDAEPIFA